MTAIAVTIDAGRVGTSFLRGLVSAVNPCAFVLLPTYLMYFLGLEGASPGTQRASLRRALLVAGAVSAGFLAVFLVAGTLFELGTSWLNSNAKYLTVVIGLGLMVLGVAMLFGYRLPIAAPRVDALAARGRRDRTVRSMFVYGVVYAVASIGCTIGLFIPTVFGTSSLLAGFVNLLAYALGMALLVTALTVTLAAANTGLLRILKSSGHTIELVAAVFVLLSGAYLVYYFWVVDVNRESDGVTTAVERFQGWVTSQLIDRWQLVAVVLAVIVGTAISYVAWRRRPGDPVGAGGE